MTTIAQVIEAAKTDHMVLVNVHSHVKGTDEFKALIDGATAWYKELDGTEKQVTWAKSLRDAIVFSLAYNIIRNRIANTINTYQYDLMQHDLAFDVAKKRLRTVACQSKSGWYIQTTSQSQIDLLMQTVRDSVSGYPLKNTQPL